MKLEIATEPTLPLHLSSNQYGWPCKTYYHIVDANGLTFHQDKKWRSKCLIEITKYIYRTEQSAQVSMDYLTKRFTLNTINNGQPNRTPIPRSRVYR